MALHWVNAGARYLHVVDLDGAFRGKPVHGEIVARIVKAVKVPVEVGGGLRTDDDVDGILDCGVARVIIGTRAWAEPGELERLVRKYGERLVVGIDAKGGRVQVKGWTETTTETASDLARRADAIGVKCIIYTDTSRDGMLEGVNAAAVGVICRAVKCSVIASGGISSAADMRFLRDLNCPNLAGAIVGKALYEGRVKLLDLQNA
jgi:phosphoribosylformimino-5-aminoimidazole carboxamide ribotide isomerase